MIEAMLAPAAVGMQVVSGTKLCNLDLLRGTLRWQGRAYHNMHGGRGLALGVRRQVVRVVQVPAQLTDDLRDGELVEGCGSGVWAVRGGGWAGCPLRGGRGGGCGSGLRALGGLWAGGVLGRARGSGGCGRGARAAGGCRAAGLRGHASASLHIQVNAGLTQRRLKELQGMPGPTPSSCFVLHSRSGAGK